MSVDETLRKSRALDRYLATAIAETLSEENMGDFAGVRDMIESLKARRRVTVENLGQKVKDLHSHLDTLDQVAQEIDKATAELQSELSSVTNGGPPLEDHGPGHPPSVAGK